MLTCYAHVYWPAVYSTIEDRCLNGIAILTLTYIRPVYSTTGNGRLNGIACLMLTYIGPAASYRSPVYSNINPKVREFIVGEYMIVDRTSIIAYSIRIKL